MSNKNKSLVALVRNIKSDINLTSPITDNAEYNQILTWLTILKTKINGNESNDKAIDLFSFLISKIEEYEVMNKLYKTEMIKPYSLNKQRDILELMFFNKKNNHKKYSKEDLKGFISATDERIEQISEGAELLCSEARSIARHTSILPSAIIGMSKEEVLKSLNSNYDFDSESHPELKKYYDDIYNEWYSKL